MIPDLRRSTCGPSALRKVTDTGYVGVLDNDPRTAGAPIASGQIVEFGPEHIIDALPPANWNPETRDQSQRRRRDTGRHQRHASQHDRSA